MDGWEERVEGEGIGGWVRAGMKESVEGERVRAGKKIKICFVIYFSGEKKKKKIMCFVIVKQKKKTLGYFTTRDPTAPCF